MIKPTELTAMATLFLRVAAFGVMFASCETPETACAAAGGTCEFPPGCTGIVGATCSNGLHPGGTACCIPCPAGKTFDGGVCE